MSHLVISREDIPLMRFQLDGDETDLGSSPRADVWLDHPKVEPVHATLVETREGDHLLNGEGDPLADGAVIALGPFQALYRNTRRNRPRKADWALPMDWSPSAQRSVGRYDNLIVASDRLFDVISRIDGQRRYDRWRVFFGPSGAGKSRVIRAAYRRLGLQQPLREVDCAALDPATAAQAMEEAGLFRPKNGFQPVFMDVHRLPMAVQERLTDAFRDDLLYFSFAQAPSQIPELHPKLLKDFSDVHELLPLAKRPGEAAALFDVLMQLQAVDAPPPLERAALDRLVAHHWPGNVRELKNLVQRLLLSGRREPIRAEDLGIP